MKLGCFLDFVFATFVPHSPFSDSGIAVLFSVVLSVDPLV